MRCLYCGFTESKVTDSRFISLDNTIRRRRECLKCGKRFTSYERIETTPILVVKKDGSRQSFDRNKIRSGIVRACDKRKVSSEQIEELIDDIEKEIYNISDSEINSVVIGEMVMQRLKKLDEVAYVRFASVYRQFTDLTNFVELLNDINAKNSSK